MPRRAARYVTALIDGAGLSRDEAEAVAVDERTTTPAQPSATADDYLHLTHPDTGRPVVFTPGETLPDWAALAVEESDDAADQPAGDEPTTPSQADDDAGNETRNTDDEHIEPDARRRPRTRRQARATQ